MKFAAQPLDSTTWHSVQQLPRLSSAVLSHYTVRFQTWGQGRPLVLVPGLAGGMGLVTPLAERMAQQHYQVISYELRGEDDCFSLRRRFDLNDLVNDLDEFIQDRRLEKPLVLGISFGGAIALHLAARNPHRLAGVITQGLNLRFEKSLLRHIAGHVLSEYPLPRNSPFVNQFFNLLFGGKPRDRSVSDFVASQIWQTDQSVMTHRFRLAEKLNLKPILNQLKLPVMLINAEKDLLVSAKAVDEFARGVPHAVIKEMPGAGHLAFVTHTEPISRLAAQFADQMIWKKK